MYWTRFFQMPLLSAVIAVSLAAPEEARASSYFQKAGSGWAIAPLKSEGPSEEVVRAVESQLMASLSQANIKPLVSADDIRAASQDSALMQCTVLPCATEVAKLVGVSGAMVGTVSGTDDDFVVVLKLFNTQSRMLLARVQERGSASNLTAVGSALGAKIVPQLTGTPSLATASYEEDTPDTWPVDKNIWLSVGAGRHFGELKPDIGTGNLYSRSRVPEGSREAKGVNLEVAAKLVLTETFFVGTRAILGTSDVDIYSVYQGSLAGIAGAQTRLGQRVAMGAELGLGVQLHPDFDLPNKCIDGSGSNCREYRELELVPLRLWANPRIFAQFQLSGNVLCEASASYQYARGTVVDYLLDGDEAVLDKTDRTLQWGGFAFNLGIVVAL